MSTKVIIRIITANLQKIKLCLVTKVVNQNITTMLSEMHIYNNYKSIYNFCTLKSYAKFPSYYLGLALQSAKVVKRNTIILRFRAISELDPVLQNAKIVKRYNIVAFTYLAQNFRAQRLYFDLQLRHV